METRLGIYVKMSGIGSDSNMKFETGPDFVDEKEGLNEKARKTLISGSEC